mmetsp:Transcript_97938/g.143384  ORF Transcript_97938/g.143384 Transcript_97938/m.143384 type:complete len:85 (-) Transcript_97938:250-504(-)
MYTIFGLKGTKLHANTFDLMFSCVSSLSLSGANVHKHSCSYQLRSQNEKNESAISFPGNQQLCVSELLQKGVLFLSFLCDEYPT